MTKRIPGLLLAAALGVVAALGGGTVPGTDAEARQAVIGGVKVGIWTSPEELATRPMTGPAWLNVVRWAAKNASRPDLRNQNDLTNVVVLAKALVAARTGSRDHQAQVVRALRLLTEAAPYTGRALPLGRELAAYVIAADLIDLRSADPGLDERFRQKLRELRAARTRPGPRNLIECHERRPNNWGTHCGASRLAVAVYLDDRAEIERAATVFRGFLGDRAAYAEFVFQTDPKQMAQSWSRFDVNGLVPINPSGAVEVWRGQAYNVDGAVIDDISRGCPFQWPPCPTGYPWEGLAGAVVQAEILHRLGYPSYEWQDQALRRAYQYLLYLHDATGGYWFDEGTVSGDDNWQPWIANLRYGTALPTRTPTRPGKVMGFTDWTHAPEEAQRPAP